LTNFKSKVNLSIPVLKTIYNIYLSNNAQDQADNLEIAAST